MADQQENNEKKNSQGKAGKIVLWIVFLLLINIAGYFFYAQIDITQDKRFTITRATKSMLQELPGKVEVTVFLAGDELPAAFKRLEKSTEELLKRFRSISGNKVSFRFVDPLGDDPQALSTLNEYRMSGLPITISAGKKGTAQKMVFPWALVSSSQADGSQKAFPVFLQESNTPELSRSILNKSEMLLEYNLANAIHQISKSGEIAIAYLTGNGEEFDFTVSSAINTLLRYYRLDTVNLQQTPFISQDYKAVIINRPLVPFSEIDKFKIDQYLMGGKSLFLNIDAASGSLDSFRNSGKFNSMPIELNLGDLFFNYGFRINSNLIEDAVSSVGIPLTAQGNNATPVLYPWVYFPVLQNGSDHPIVHNLSGVLARFVSSIDTNENDPKIRKTPLLVSSSYSSILATPAPVILETAIVEKNPAEFRKKNLLASVLLEGKFSSLYAARMPLDVRNFVSEHHLNNVKQSDSSAKIIVTADGQLLFNEFSEKNGPSDMGVYQFSDYRFDNKSFMLNCLAYLTDKNNLLAARTKTFHTHLLDPKRVEQERSFWQMVNIGIPALIVIIFGGVYFYIRKKKFG